MSPATKHRHGPGGKGSEKAQGKEWKASSRHSSVGSGMPTSAYNPGTGMFHMVGSSISETVVSNHSGRFRSIDDSDDIGSTIGSYSEYDSMSNNGSCSGESEDQSQHLIGKDKKGQPPGVVGGASDKRDKIRYKNEKKHQRQKERRAQELRDRCTGYIMSRKLEALAQQLVAMGFTSDRATMALILNEGNVERSVAWLLEGGEEQVKEDWSPQGSLKIDISEELARIADLEIRFKYLRVEIERAVVTCEGDLDKAAEWLRDRHPQIPLPASEYGSHDRTKEQTSSPAEAAPYLMIAQGRGAGLLQGPSSTSRAAVGSGQRQWPAQGRGSVPVSYPSSGRHPSDSRAPPFENGLPYRREPTVRLTPRDPVVAPQLSQSPISPPPNFRSGSVSPSLSPSSWNGSVPSASSPSSVLFFNGTAGDVLFKGVVSSKSAGELYTKHAEEAVKVHPLPPKRLDGQSSPREAGSSFSARDNTLPSGSMPASTSHLRSQSTPRFLSGWGSGLSGGPADWSMWVSGGCDYKTIDWSMGASPSTSSESSVWGVSSTFASMLNLSDHEKPRLGLAGEGISQGYIAETGEPSSSVNYQLWNSTNRGNSVNLGLQEKTLSDTGSSSGMGVPEWTSPFAGKDLFTLPHQALHSPLL